MLIDDFNNARIGKPFETLGLQKVDGESGFLLRAWLPSAKSVEVRSIDGTKHICDLTVIDVFLLYIVESHVCSFSISYNYYT